jgi:hypothetical protein
MGIFVPSVNITATIESLSLNVGIHEPRADNPVSDWNHVYITYCTGDIFLGNNVKDYGEETGVFHHKGAANTRAVMEWVYAQVESPDKVLTTGSSAGALGSMIWAPHIMNHYNEADHDYFGDSFVGILTDVQWDGGHENWKMAGAFPDFVPGMKEIAQGSYRPNLGAEILLANAKWKPTASFAQYTSNADAVQVLFYLIGYGTADWTELMRGQMEKIGSSGTVNTHWYIAGGDAHCSLIYEDFYTIESEGVMLHDYFGDVLDRSKASSLKNVDCAVNGKCTDSVAPTMGATTVALAAQSSNSTTTATTTVIDYQHAVAAFEKWIASTQEVGAPKVGFGAYSAHLRGKKSR